MLLKLALDKNALKIKEVHKSRSLTHPAFSLMTLALCLGSFFTSSCSNSSGQQAKILREEPTEQKKQQPLQERDFPKNIGQIPVPAGFSNSTGDVKTFGNFLSGLSLKEEGTPVKLYNGENKWNQQAHYAVVNLPIGSKDLHQCADAVMRLRADFLRKEGRYNKINFHFVSGFNCEYSKWIAGNRIKVNGSKVSWYTGGSKGDSDESYWKYLETVWSYASTLSLEKELISKSVSDIETGDVWIKGGSPGHAIIVAKVIVNEAGEKLFLLAQSYMPAQELHILKNPRNEELSPWYEIPTDELISPEWTFTLDQLRQWP